MGAAASKSADSPKGDFAEGIRPSSPILTPQIRRLNLDPRSPSLDIARTPIEILKTPISGSAVTPSANGLNSIENFNDENEQKVAVDTIVLPDPRSPTTEFHRTPIVTDAILKLHNKNLDNARMPLVAITPTNPKRSQTVVKKIYGTPEIDSARMVSPKLLESSPIIVKFVENKRNSVVGLLETNIDFVETDLDVVIQNKILSNMEISPELEINSNCEETSQSVNGSATNILEEDGVDDAEEINESADHQSQNSLEAVTLIAGMQSFETETINQAEIMQNMSENYVQVNELDRKLTNLIYEDKQLEFSPKQSNSIRNHHTPLRDRNANSQPSKSIPVLKVSDKPTKLTGGISRIPVFKEKRVKGKINVQCENTPPRMKTKRSEWSAEDSLII